MARIGVVLLTMGEPESLDQVQPFLQELLNDPELVRLPFPSLQPLFAWIGSRLGQGDMKNRLSRIGGGSPLRRLTERQRTALEQALRPCGDFRVYVAMRYGPPSAAEAVRLMQADKVQQAVALPLYPQYCRATTGSSLNDLRRCTDIPIQEITSWPEYPGYIAALAEQVSRTLPKTPDNHTHMLFSAHSVPEAFPLSGDPYQKETEATVRALHRLFPNVPYSLAFQSRTGRGRWLKPDIAEEAARLGRAGVKTLVVVPISFVCDHSETLYDLDIVLRRQALAAGIETFMRMPSLNDSLAFVTALKELILARIVQ